MFRVVFNDSPPPSTDHLHSCDVPEWEDDEMGEGFDFQGVECEDVVAWAKRNAEQGEMVTVTAMVNGYVALSWLWDYSRHPHMPQPGDAIPGAVQVRVFGPWPQEGVYPEDLVGGGQVRLPARGRLRRKPWRDARDS